MQTTCGFRIAPAAGGGGGRPSMLAPPVSSGRPDAVAPLASQSRAGAAPLCLAEMHAPIAFELAQVERAIQSQLRKLCGDAHIPDKVFRSFFHSQGKKLRPRLVILSAFALRQDNLRGPEWADTHESLIALGAIAELVHDASLMHDDVLDGASTRRAQPSLNAEFGNKIAILVGDILYSQAFEMLVGRSTGEISLMLTDCVRRMCRAEIANLFTHEFDTYCTIIEDKTASLMTFCCAAGARVARRDGDSAEVATALEKFGYSFGMVYQLTDDLCDRDSAVVMGKRAAAVALLHTHIRAAEHALNNVPASPYRTGLLQLLQYVVASSERLTGDEAKLGELGDEGR